jgi:hypothetical protein
VVEKTNSCEWMLMDNSLRRKARYLLGDLEKEFISLFSSFFLIFENGSFGSISSY